MGLRYELRHLKGFIAVAEELNFHRAAERLNVAQPALSRTIKQLEDFLGLRLLVRSSRRVSLTEEGRTFLEGAYQAIRLLEEAGRNARRSLEGEVGRLRIGYTDFAITGCLPQILEAFRNNHPGVQLELVHGFTYRQIEQLHEHQLDCAFVTGPVGDHDLSSIPVQLDRLVAIVSNRHPLSRLDSVCLEALRDEPFVMGEREGWRHFHRHVQAICLRRGFQPRVIQEAYNSEGIFGFIEANLGVTLHAECVRNYYRKGTRILSLQDVEERIPTEMAWLPKDVTPVQQCFIQFIRTQHHARIANQ